MFDGWKKQRIVIEGDMPERALSRLARAGVCVYRAKKCKKNQILCVVDKKDSEKVFAIYPKICYNNKRESVYVITRAGATGVYRVWKTAVKRLGLSLGACVFFLSAACAQLFVWDVRVQGETAYTAEAVAILKESGIRVGKTYRKAREDVARQKLLALPRVSFVSVQKRGLVVWVELRVSAFEQNTLKGGDMLSAVDGTVQSLVVLRGTPLKKTGETVRAGEPIVGAFVRTDGEKTAQSVVVAKAEILVVAAFESAATAQQDARAEGLLLAADGSVKSLLVTPKDGGGFFVEVRYVVEQRMNF